MSNVTKLHPTELSQAALSQRQLATLKATTAKTLTMQEFDLFIEYCRSVELDPIRKQVVPIIFSANDAQKRAMTIVVTIDGLRTLAERATNYRPDENEPQYFIKPELVDKHTNPLGIERCSVTVHKQDKSGKWNKVNGTAYWEEFAPIVESAEGGFEWVDSGETWPDTGKPKKRKKPIGESVQMIDPKTLWAKMPRIMIAKCAEAQALRKGWPSTFSGVNVDAEFDRKLADDRAASEVVEQYNEVQRLGKIDGGERAITFMLDASVGLERIAVGQVADKVLEAARKATDLNGLASLLATNRDSLKELWAVSPTDAHGLKVELEKLDETLRAKELAK